MTDTSPNSELLAPAGSLEAYFAALEFGADAVYCGLPEFSARAKAKNFSLADLERITSHAHDRSRKLYVALNTLIKEDELPRLLDILGSLAAIKVDALIIQDLGLWRLARRHFPDLALHASTQMTVHNSAGVRMLERLGFTRAVLARELTLAEIQAIRDRTSLELEHFIHGALCFSVSGQCLFSSFLNGTSGNRGRCAQPCRRRYAWRDKQGYYLSTSDLCALDLVPQLLAAGIKSLKIEGRMKSAEYVARVVAAYRLVLDAPATDRRAAVARARELLALAYGRAATRGFLAGPNPANLSLPEHQGSIGRLLGRITGQSTKAIAFKTDDQLHAGDRLRVLPQNDLEGAGFTVTELWVDNRPVLAARAGALVRVAVPAGAEFRTGDAVYKVRGEQLFTLSSEACRKKLDQTRPRPWPVRLTLACTSETLSILATAEGISLARDYGVETVPAHSQPLSTQILGKAFGRTGDAPLVLAEMITEALAPVIIHPTRLKEIRRDFYGELTKALRQAAREQDEHRRSQALAALIPDKPAAGPKVAAPDILVTVADWAEALQLMADPRINRVLVPLTPATVRDCDRTGRRLRDLPERLVWDLPAMIFEAEWLEYRGVARRLSGLGFRRFRLHNPGHFPLFDGVNDLDLSCGFRLYTSNSQAALAWQKLGASEFTLSLEDDRNNHGRILSRDLGLPARLTVYGPIPLLISRIPIKALPAEARLQSTKGESFRVERPNGLTVLNAATDFSLLGRLDEVNALGVDRILIDISHLGARSPAGRQVLAALFENKPVPATTTFNFERGWR